MARQYDIKDFFLGPGLLTATQFPLSPKQQEAALRRARRKCGQHRFAGVWIDNGRSGSFSFDVDAALRRRSRTIRSRIAIFIAPNAEHCPFDPPFITDQTLALAKENGLAGIIISAGRGVIAQKVSVVEEADRLGFPILAID